MEENKINGIEKIIFNMYSFNLTTGIRIIENNNTIISTENKIVKNIDLCTVIKK